MGRKKLKLKLKVSSFFTSHGLLHLQLQPSLVPSGIGLSPPRFRKASMRERGRERAEASCLGRGRQAYGMYARILVLRLDNVCSAEGTLINGYWNGCGMDGCHCYGCVCCAAMPRQGKEVESFLWRQGACAGYQIKVVGEDAAEEKGWQRRGANKSNHLSLLPVMPYNHTSIPNPRSTAMLTEFFVLNLVEWCRSRLVGMDYGYGCLLVLHLTVPKLKKRQPYMLFISKFCLLENT